VEKAFEFRHLPGQEPAILANAVTAHRRRPVVGPLSKELQRALLRLPERDVAFENALGQTGLAVLRRVPLVHRIHDVGWLPDRQHGPLGKFVQVSVRDDRRDLDDRIGSRIETCHLEVDPDQVGTPVGLIFAIVHALFRVVSDGR
jgi:hypothetical protein